MDKLNCPLGGDEADDCKDCIYSIDYHFVDGQCVARPDTGEGLHNARKSKTFQDMDK